MALAVQVPVEKMIPKQKSGTDFLAGSHFQISQDPIATDGKLKSIFKKDYVPWNVTSKPASSQPPAPADVIQRDARFFNQKASETKQSFEYRFLQKPELATTTFRATNFKMDSDVSKFNSFKTSHDIDFPPKDVGSLQSRMPTGNRMESFIPQGDREKALEPMSDYKEKYIGHDALSCKPKRAGSKHQGGPATITGDQRQHHFHTTQKDTFKGTSLPRIAPIPPARDLHIPTGDRDMVREMQSVQQEAYIPHKNKITPYNRAEVSKKLLNTSFKQGDGHGVWDDYTSTFKHYYSVKNGAPAMASIEGSKRNHSDVPEGDDHNTRNAHRSNMTTYRFHHGDPPPTKRAIIQSGANKRTRSNVSFGEPRLNGEFYDTTTDDNFRPKQVPYYVMKEHLNTKSHIPLDYYMHERKDDSTYRCSYESPHQNKLIPNPVKIQHLRESHIHAPLGEERQFSTEHVDQYAPKKSDKIVVDAGKLQRSTVPLGSVGEL